MKSYIYINHVLKLLHNLKAINICFDYSIAIIYRYAITIFSKYFSISLWMAQYIKLNIKTKIKNRK